MSGQDESVNVKNRQVLLVPSYRCRGLVIEAGIRTAMGWRTATLALARAV